MQASIFDSCPKPG